MITASQGKRIAERLTNEIGFNDDVGAFVYQFAALDSDRDIDYALDVLGTTSSEEVKKAIGIVFDEIIDP